MTSLDEEAKQAIIQMPKEIARLTRLPARFGELVRERQELEEEKEYLVRITAKQTKIVDNKSKAIVCEPREARELISRLNGHMQELRKPRAYAGYGVSTP